MAAPLTPEQLATSILNYTLYADRAPLSVDERVAALLLWADCYCIANSANRHHVADIPIADVNTLTHRNAACSKPDEFVFLAIAHQIASHPPTVINPLGLPKQTLVAYEAYIFARLWPKRFRSILARHTRATTWLPSQNVHTENTIAFLLDTANNGLPDFDMERAVLELFCELSTPLATHIRFSHRKRPYQRYRDYDAEAPCPEFIDNIRMVLFNLPVEILQNKTIYANNPLLYTCACLAIFKVYTTITLTRENRPVINKKEFYALNIYTYASANINWCPPFSLYYDEPVSYVVLPDKKYVALAENMAGPDLIFAYIATVAPFFPLNKVINNALLACTHGVQPIL